MSKVMPPDYTEKSWNIIRDEEAIARMEATRQAVLAESPFHSKPRATAKASTSARDAALSMRTDESTFEEADLEELMTPLPKEVLQRGMCVLLCPSWSCHHHRALSRLLVARPPSGTNSSAPRARGGPRSVHLASEVEARATNAVLVGVDRPMCPCHYPPRACS